MPPAGLLVKHAYFIEPDLNERRGLLYSLYKYPVGRKKKKKKSPSQLEFLKMERRATDSTSTAKADGLILLKATLIQYSAPASGYYLDVH